MAQKGGRYPSEPNKNRFFIQHYNDSASEGTLKNIETLLSNGITVNNGLPPTIDNIFQQTNVINSVRDNTVPYRTIEPLPTYIDLFLLPLVSTNLILKSTSEDDISNGNGLRSVNVEYYTGITDTSLTNINVDLLGTTGVIIPNVYRIKNIKPISIGDLRTNQGILSLTNESDVNIRYPGSMDIGSNHFNNPILFIPKYTTNKKMILKNFNVNVVRNTNTEEVISLRKHVIQNTFEEIVKLSTKGTSNPNMNVNLENYSISNTEPHTFIITHSHTGTGYLSINVYLEGYTKPI